MVAPPKHALLSRPELLLRLQQGRLDAAQLARLILQRLEEVTQQVSTVNLSPLSWFVYTLLGSLRSLGLFTNLLKLLSDRVRKYYLTFIS